MCFTEIVCVPSTFVHNNVFYWYDFYSFSFFFILDVSSRPEFVLFWLIYIQRISIREAGRGLELELKKLQTCLSNLKRHVSYKLEFLYCLSYVLKHIKFSASLMKSILYRNIAISMHAMRHKILS